MLTFLVHKVEHNSSKLLPSSGRNKAAEGLYLNGRKAANYMFYLVLNFVRFGMHTIHHEHANSLYEETRILCI